MDETNIKVKGRWRYLYWAVDKAGDTIDFLFRAKRDKAVARRFFQKAMAQNGTPETVTIDKSGSNLAALHAERHHCLAIGFTNGPERDWRFTLADGSEQTVHVPGRLDIS